MSELDYDRIARILGGSITQIRTPSFGNFAAIQASSHRLLSLHDTHRRIHISDKDSAAIVRAFEETREGYELDRVLIDPVLSDRFISKCRKYGVNATATLINKKLQAFRKANKYFQLKPATKPSGLNAHKYNYVAELAYSQLTYHSELSEDDVITDIKIGEEFAQIACTIDPYAPIMMVKWALISLRKARSFGGARAEKILNLQPKSIERRFHSAGYLQNISTDKLPEDEGIFALREETNKHRYLYLEASKNLRESVIPFRNGKPFTAIANSFWTPNPASILVRYTTIERKKLAPTARDWSFRLIQEWQPVFNLPVEIRTKEAA